MVDRFKSDDDLFQVSGQDAYETRGTSEKWCVPYQLATEVEGLGKA